MYAQVCIHPDIDFVVGVLDKYLSDHGMQHWKAIKYMILEILATLTLILLNAKIANAPHLDTVMQELTKVIHQMKGSGGEVTIGMITPHNPQYMGLFEFYRNHLPPFSGNSIPVEAKE
ncbi:hypothetical protein CR513_21393, partial [Mucuna pruriens]